MDVEIQRFVLDFKVSRALAVVQHVSGLSHGVDHTRHGGVQRPRESKSCPPEGLWGREVPEIEWEPDPVHASCSLESVSAALAVVRRAVEVSDRWPLELPNLPIGDEEWALIRAYDTHCPATDVHDALGECQKTCKTLLERAPLYLQLPLLRHNFWALKPSCGQFGRGIMLLDRLPARPAQLLDWAACVGRGGQKGGKDLTQGCVLQKLIECPHLLDKAILDSRATDNASQLCMCMPADPALKYNLRMIIVATLRLPCRIWLYKHGFISVALRAYTEQLNPLSHITNLRGQGNESQRRWPLEDLDRHLQVEQQGPFDEVLRPQIKKIISSLFHALALAPCSLLPLEESQEANGHRSAMGKKVRRFGFDFLVDESLSVWLLEVNFLKNGYALGHAQSGPAGDAKRTFVDQFMADEHLLRTALATRTCGSGDLPSTFEELLPQPP
ncbi:Ttll9 [Symbiodinium natans]|uniref:Ttll9 protein n=1 Tax=Symbiodinium natans TaxID=878477 RepID=A0A812TA08_9DINO|nr:Ttll9 [Symbiodinium natans]